MESINPVQVFTENGLDPIMDAIEEEARKIGTDISTDKNRKAIISMARKVASSKIVLESKAKDLTEGWRDQTAKVNAEKNRMIERMDILRDDIRAPVTEWQAKDDDRIQKHQDAILEIQEMAENFLDEQPSVFLIKQRIQFLEAKEARDWEEFATTAETTLTLSLQSLRKRLADREQYEAEQKELAEFRRKEEERKQKEHDENIAKEAATKAKADAERKALKDAEEVQRKADAEKARIHREKKEAEEKAEKERKKIEDEKKAAESRAIQAEQDKKDTEARAEREAKEAKEQAKKAEADRLDAEMKADRDKKNAVQAEKDRVAAEKQREIDAAAKREANKKHKAKINNEAKDAIQKVIDEGINGEDPVKDIVAAIARGEIPHVKIEY
ncbi:MAG: hypothetical protein E2O79_09975 [Caldithrix sp.]|nr:MAG: hypothetical protein E2O79_09975 [Caldithrix sp.]